MTNEGEHRLLSLRKLNLTPFGKPKILFEEDFIFVRRKLEFSPKENSFSFGHKFRAAYKEEHERNFLRSVFRQYKEGYPLDRLFPSRAYRSLQECGVIHHSRAEKLYALSLFKNYRPTSRLYMPEEARQAIINSKAMAWLLKREFDAMTELRFDDEGVRMAA